MLNAFRHQWKLHGSETAGLALVVVLNAFRHQWKLHLNTVHGATQADDVLNAFRHQWKLHRGLCIARCAADAVLNAFRHQWKLHAVVSVKLRTFDFGSSARFPHFEGLTRSSPER